VNSGDLEQSPFFEENGRFPSREEIRGVQCPTCRRGPGELCEGNGGVPREASHWRRQARACGLAGRQIAVLARKLREEREIAAGPSAARVAKVRLAQGEMVRQASELARWERDFDAYS
jgi:hypothetical protein